MLPTPDSPQAVGWLLLALAAIAVALNQVLRLADRWKDKPPAGEIQRDALERFATKMECEQRHRAATEDLRNVWSKIGGVERGLKADMDAKVGSLARELVEMERRINNADEERTLKLHDRLNEILGDMREMRGEMNKNKRI